MVTPMMKLCIERRLLSLPSYPPRSRLSTISTVHRGTAFEERSLKILHNGLSMSLRRVGGKSDGGIDLLGWWWLPSPDQPDDTRRRVRVFAQCKAEKKKISPKYVRELEGVLHRYITMPIRPVDCTVDSAPSNAVSRLPQYPMVALLVSESPFTKSTILRAQSSPVPLFLLHIPAIPEISDLPDEQDGSFGMAIWNPALAGVQGLLGGQMETRWERSPNGHGRPGLWWQGRRLKNWTPPLGSQLELKIEDRIYEEPVREL